MPQTLWMESEQLKKVGTWGRLARAEEHFLMNQKEVSRSRQF